MNLNELGLIDRKKRAEAVQRYFESTKRTQDADLIQELLKIRDDCSACFAIVAASPTREMSAGLLHGLESRNSLESGWIIDALVKLRETAAVPLIARSLMQCMEIVEGPQYTVDVWKHHVQAIETLTGRSLLRFDENEWVDWVATCEIVKALSDEGTASPGNL